MHTDEENDLAQCAGAMAARICPNWDGLTERFEQADPPAYPARGEQLLHVLITLPDDFLPSLISAGGLCDYVAANVRDSIEVYRPIGARLAGVLLTNLLHDVRHGRKWVTVATPCLRVRIVARRPEA